MTRDTAKNINISPYISILFGSSYLRLLAQCLNQLRQCVAHLYYLDTVNLTFKNRASYIQDGRASTLQTLLFGSN
jgi:hypothetical protein